MNGAISRTFDADLAKRAQYADGGDIYPLKDLSLLNGVVFSGKDNAANRKKYWDIYSRIYPANGCDETYGEATMPASEALRYVKMLCRIQDAAAQSGDLTITKPRSSTKNSLTEALDVSHTNPGRNGGAAEREVQL